MLNIKYLTSGLLNANYFNMNNINNINNLNNFNKKIEYYRLAEGFKDANNSFINYVIKN